MTLEERDSYSRQNIGDDHDVLKDFTHALVEAGGGKSDFRLSCSVSSRIEFGMISINATVSVLQDERGRH